MSPIIFAILAAVAFGIWTVFHKFASTYVDQVFGAIFISFVAVCAGLLVLVPRLKEVQLVSDVKGIYFLAGAGICAFLLDFLVLQAYSRGLSISVGGPIVIGGSIAIAAVAGFLLGDSLTWDKLAGIAFVLIGAIILSVSVQ